MDLHLHLSAAFRALDRKWGTPIELDTADLTKDSLPYIPAVVDLSTTTFSSEEYLRMKRNRPTPYSRFEIRGRKENLKRIDSFSDISSSRLQSISDLENIIPYEKDLEDDEDYVNVDFEINEKIEISSSKTMVNSARTLTSSGNIMIDSLETLISSSDGWTRSTDMFTRSRDTLTTSTLSIDSSIEKKKYFWKQIKENVSMPFRRQYRKQN